MENDETQRRTNETNARFKAYGNKHHDVVKQQAETLKPACLRCMKLDADKGQDHDIKHYFDIGMKLVQSSEIRDQKTSKIIGWMLDFRCEKNHGTTMRVDIDRAKDAFAQKLLTKRDMERAGIEVKQ